MHRHGSAFHACGLLDDSMVLQLFSQSVEKILAQLGVRDRPSAEEDRQLHLVSCIQELRCLAALGLEIMPANLGLDPDFLELRNLLMAPGVALFSALFVPKLSIVHQATNGRRRVRGNLDKVEPLLAGHLQRFARGDDTDLTTFIVDQPHFTDTNPLVDACLCWSGNSSPP